MFELVKQSKKSSARTGILKTKSGSIVTPFFMPIATRGVVKSISYKDLEKLNPEAILSNTYHTYLKPGLEVIKKSGGLHKFMHCKFPILTDSGGFQVFSLSKIRKVQEKGVEFYSVYDGSRHFFTPELVMKIQSILDSDMQMVLDVCIDSKSKISEIKKAVELTSLWAEKCQIAKSKLDKKNKNLLFCIIQGGTNINLRKKSLGSLNKLDKNYKWGGYAIGGLAVGETNKEMYKVLDNIVKLIPNDRPKYLMGVGYPENIVSAVKSGIDMFDCVIPSREARHGRLYYRKNESFTGKFYETINMSNAKYINNMTPINKNSKFEELRIYSKAYLSHIFKVNDPLALRLMTLNNLEFYLDLMNDIRKAIALGKF